MEKISALMDGELAAKETALQIQRLRDDDQLQEGWATYHLIGDCLRNEAELSRDFMKRVHERLQGEPTVLAPRIPMRRSASFVRHTLPMAAAVAGIAVVAWLGLSSPMFSGKTTPADDSRVVAAAPAVHTAPVTLRGSVSDYLTAHQEFSPRTAMQGVASYVRTVSDDQQIQDR